MLASLHRKTGVTEMTEIFSKRLWRRADGALPNSLVFTYILLGQFCGIVLMAMANVWMFIPGVLLTAHSLIIAAYMLHELAHNIVLQDRKINTYVGECISWLCGSAYAPFQRIQLMHMRHHCDRADIALFDPQVFLKNHPSIKQVVYALEWFHIPAVELIMHYQVLVRPFIREDFYDQRQRIIIMAATRILFFYFLFSISPFVLIGYAIAYLILIKACFLADAFAHTYEAYIIEQYKDPVPQEGRNAEYDKAHTYSNLISERWPWLNLLNLNFGYHTAHHDCPATPWYKLPEEHYKTYPDDAPQILPYRQLLGTIHHNRLNCIIADDFGDVVGQGKDRAEKFLGVHGVSFLSIV